MANEKKKQCIMKHLSSKNRDYRFLYDYSLLRPGTVKRIAKLAKEFIESGRDVEIDLPFKFRFEFTSADRALDYLLQIQLFYRLVCADVESSPWMQAHHCQPKQLNGLDVADNLVVVPIPVHWYLHCLHRVIGEMVGNKRLEKHALNSCQIMQFDPDFLIRCGFDQVEVDRVRKAHMASRVYWSEAKIRTEAAKYNSKSAFERGNRSAYDATRTRFPGLLDELFENRYQSWTEESIRSESAKYNSKSAFRRGSNGAYEAARTRFPGLLDELFGVGGKWGTEDKIRTEAAKYTSKKAFRWGSGGAYDAARTRFPGLLDELFGVGRITDKWNEESIRQEAAQYDSKNAFQRGNRGSYAAARTRFPGLLDELFGVGSQWNKWNEESIRTEARKYTSKSAFQRGSNGAYKAALKRFPGLLDELFENQLQSWNEESIRATARRYPTPFALQKHNLAAYLAAHRHGLLSTLCFQPLTIFNRDVKRRAVKLSRHRKPPQIINLFKPKTVDSTPSV